MTLAALRPHIQSAQRLQVHMRELIDRNTAMMQSNLVEAVRATPPPTSIFAATVERNLLTERSAVSILLKSMEQSRPSCLDRRTRRLHSH